MRAGEEGWGYGLGWAGGERCEAGGKCEEDEGGGEGGSAGDLRGGGVGARRGRGRVQWWRMGRLVMVAMMLHYRNHGAGPPEKALLQTTGCWWKHEDGS